MIQVFQLKFWKTSYCKGVEIFRVILRQIRKYNSMHLLSCYLQVAHVMLVLFSIGRMVAPGAWSNFLICPQLLQHLFEQNESFWDLNVSLLISLCSAILAWSRALVFFFSCILHNFIILCCKLKYFITQWVLYVQTAVKYFLSPCSKLLLGVWELTISNLIKIVTECIGHSGVFW